MVGLSLRQQLFVEYYLGNRGNATDAARQAGYKGSANVLGVQGHENLRNPKIQAAIKQRLEQHGMPRDEILARLTDMARADMGEFVHIKHNRLIVNLRKARRAGRTHVIRRLRKGKHGWSIEMVDSLRAIELLGRYYGLWNRHERALRREYLRIIKRRIDGKELPCTLADLVAAAEERAAARRQDRETESADRSDVAD